MTSKKQQWTMVFLLVLVGLIFIGSYVHKIRKMGGPILSSGVMNRSDRTGEPVGADFSLFWAASYLALNGEPLEVYDFSRLRAVEQQLFGPAVALPWPYPPTFLLMVLPLSRLPYLTSLTIWLGATLTVFLIILCRIGPHPLTFWLALAFPGTFINFICGQNGFLSAALLGGGLLLLGRFPLAAGLVLGLLCYKPHLALLVPVALLAGRHWQALLGAVTSVLALSVASGVVLGWKVWGAFVTNLPLALGWLGDHSGPWQKMPSVFAATRLMGGWGGLAWTLQALVMLAVAAAVVWVWLRGASPATRNSVLVLGLLLFPPHIFNYDLALLALPLTWLGWAGYQKGWLPGEPILLILGWVMPLFFLPSPELAIRLPIGPLVLGSLFLLSLRMAITSTKAVRPGKQSAP